MSSVQMRPSTVPARRECHRSLPRIARLAGFVVAGCVLPWLFAEAQGLTGTLIVAVEDQHGAALGGARVRVSSPELMGGSVTLTTNEHGQSRLPTLPPGTYVLDIELPGFAAYHEVGIAIGAGETLERAAVLRIAGVAASIVVEGSGSRIEARDSGFGTRRFGCFTNQRTFLSKLSCLAEEVHHTGRVGFQLRCIPLNPVRAEVHAVE